MVETLNELSQLRDSGFGRPWPRHGLKLLYWFAKDCVSLGDDNVMLCEYEPADGYFGFHSFEKRNYGNKLLPDEYHPYYVVGNLNTKKYPKAKDLPKYVSEDYSSNQLDSNTDRVIVSLNGWELERVYVTQHHDRSNYDPNATHRISRGLLMIIREMSLDTFLEKMKYAQPVSPPTIDNRPATTNTESQDSTAVTIPSSDSDDSEPPETQGLLTSTQNPSENLRREEGFWEKFCTIL
ncbi:uncharacterized protein LOC120466756 [Pimephales promelas]|uniref:uncharacterized protein LOC120466756 n=1 Tax=Pimephales promelas TaxID=90988 RepID=UPI001955CE4F|nr:uncharacterized protein LOC120466756 [Pimephales promelas]XP_039511296.1 uncharacterized protein LOC120466756 [Pimephales promelas]